MSSPSRTTHFRLGLVALAAVLLALAGWLARATQAAPPGIQAAADCNIWWNEVLHDTFNADYRSIVGSTTPGNTVKLRLRMAQSDLTSARVRVWNDRANTQTYYNLAWDGAFDTDPVTYDWWFVDIPVGAQPTILYYFFEMNDNGNGGCSPADQDFYVDDNPKFYGGGYGAMSDNYDDSRSFQITVYDPAFNVPSWMQRGVVYQIFPDRFRDGDPGNNPTAGRFSYDRAGGAIARSNQADWNYTICDPRGTYTPVCINYYGDNFYGGDLRGVIDKLDDGYFQNLGVTVLYLNPIFRSPSNHKYDSADFLTIDPDFGDLATFQELTAKAEAAGIKVVLDGVFNHVSSDSTYFDRYSRYDAAGNLTSPNGPGVDDNSGGCESPVSPYRSWFYIPDIGNPGGGATDRCDPTDNDDPGGAWTQTYEAWYGFGSLPKLQANLPAVRNLIWSNGLNSVGPYWINQGADGWRFDVGGDVDCGLTCDPANDYWEGFRAAVRAVNPETLTLGEEWQDASAWLLGNEWDSVMNYRFRSALLSWLFTGCSGSGCSGGTMFEDNDSNAGSASGAISAISPSQFNARLMSIWEDYPAPALKAMMNLEGSHDTNRVRFLLRKINNDNDSAAVQRLKEWWIFAFTYVGAPTLYYGDEIALNHDGVFAGGKWEDDPYNRVPFPWPDETGSTYSYDATAQAAGVYDQARKLASIRHSYRALQDGDVTHGIVINDANKLYGYARTNNDQTALIVLNRSNTNHPVTIGGLNGAPYSLPNGTVLLDALNGGSYTVSGGQVSLTVNSNWGVILLEAAELDTPAAPGVRIAKAGPDVVLSWPPVTTDTLGGRELATAYEVWRSAEPYFTPGDAGSSLLATVTPPTFGAPDGLLGYTDAGVIGGAPQPYYYVVRALNAAQVVSAESNRVGKFDFSLVKKGTATVTLPLNVAGVAAVDDVKAAIGNGVTRIQIWNYATQRWLTRDYVRNTGPNFPVATGDVLRVRGNNNITTLFTWIGEVPAPGSVSYHFGVGTNEVMIPLDIQGLTDAAALATSIGPKVKWIMQWNSATQTAEKYFPATGAGNFSVAPGGGYHVRVTAASTWP